jgi:alcohol dehydrogenase (quinone), cytochrome c subunit
VTSPRIRRSSLRSLPVAAVLLLAILVVLCERVRRQPYSDSGSLTTGAVVDNSSDQTVVRGAYLVRAANCISCHSAPDGASFAGGKAFETPYPFLGTIYSSNISPDRETGIGAWSETQFIRAMRYGIAPDGRNLFPAFPYTAFTKLSTPDIRAIFAYLKTVPAVRRTPPANSFWFRQRWLMLVWNALFFSPGQFAPATNQSPEWNRGAYLVEALGHCGACHEPRNLLMAQRAGATFSGGELLEVLDGTRTRRWTAPDLTPSKTGLAAWSGDDLHKYLKSGHSRRAGVYGPMNEVFADSLRFLTDDDINAMVTYLKAASPAPPNTSATLMAGERALGQALYDKYCEDCHLSTGRGAVRKAPTIAVNPVVQDRDPASLINVILFGAHPAAEVPQAFDAYDDMPGFGGKLNDEEVARLATFLRGNFGNSGSVVTAARVAKQR